MTWIRQEVDTSCSHIPNVCLARQDQWVSSFANRLNRSDNPGANMDVVRKLLRLMSPGTIPDPTSTRQARPEILAPIPPDEARRFMRVRNLHSELSTFEEEKGNLEEAGLQAQLAGAVNRAVSLFKRAGQGHRVAAVRLGECRVLLARVCFEGNQVRGPLEGRRIIYPDCW
jgi:hypothetical protein